MTYFQIIHISFKGNITLKEKEKTKMKNRSRRDLKVKKLKKSKKKRFEENEFFKSNCF